MCSSTVFKYCTSSRCSREYIITEPRTAHSVNSLGERAYSLISSIEPQYDLFKRVAMHFLFSIIGPVNRS